jgi:4-amino-4-deoxy-L-arabinose transferase-like glycosyltransferase
LVAHVKSKLLVPAIVLVALLQFCLFLNHRDITNAHEGRVAATAREMLERHDWVMPYCNGVPRLAKPPLAYWATMIAWTIGGSREVWLARLPAALCGALAVLLVMDLARRTLGRGAAISAGVVWVTTWFIVDEYRKAMADPYLAFFTLLCVWVWITAHAKASRALLLVAYVTAALAALAKGHLILIHAPLALIPYHLLCRKRVRFPIVHVIGAIICLCIALPWFVHIYRVAGNVWATDALGIETNSGDKAAAPWHYLAALPLTSAPWTVITLIGALMPFIGKGRRERRGKWLLLWLFATVVVFTFVPMKKNAYLLPAMPAQTLLTASALAAMVRLPRAAKDAKNESFVQAAYLVAAMATLGVCVYVAASIERFEIDPPAPLMAGAGLVVLLLLCIRQLAPVFRSPRTLLATAAMFAMAVHLLVAWIIPNRDNRRSDRELALTARQALDDGVSLVLIGPGLREDVVFYLGRTVPRIDSIEQLPADFKGVAIVTPEQYLPVNRSNRGDEGTTSPNRPPKDTIRLFTFPKATKQVDR